MDNLESQTYEAFEKDPVKYKQYERAIVKALELEKQKEGVDTTVLMVSQSAIRPSSLVVVCLVRGSVPHVEGLSLEGGRIRRTGILYGVGLMTLL